MKRLSICCAMTMFVSVLAFGQAETTGRISGTVVDEEGEPITDARVTLISPALQGERTTRTNDNGEFLAALLPVGPYALSVAAPGKQTAQVSLRLAVGQTVPLEIVMRRGEGLVEKVTVHGVATPLESTIVGENFNYGTEVEELPIVSRNINNVARYAPNIQTGVWAPPTLTGVETGLVISGAPQYDSMVQLDGAEISSQWGAGLILYLEDAVEEVQVMTTGLPARYGRFQGGVVNAITKTGANEFNGAVRAEFSKESWNSKTPFGEEQSDDLDQAYQATFGGYFLRDSVWFFAGARIVPTKTQSFTTLLTQQSYEQQSDEDRWQVKLRGAPTPDHVIEASYLDRERVESGAPVFIPGDLGGATGGGQELFSLLTLSYQGVLGPRSFLDFRASRKDGTTFWGGDPELGSWFIDATSDDLVIYNNAFSDRSDEWVRDNRTASLAYTRVFSGGRTGSHTLEVGAQFVRETQAGSNRQSPSGLGLGVFRLGGTPFATRDPQSGETRFNLNSFLAGGDTFLMRQEDLAGEGLEHDLDNYAVYAQDSWQLRKWRVDAGLRWETYRVFSPRPDLDPDINALAPRIAVTRMLLPALQIQATWGRYFGRFHESSLLDGVLSSPRIERLYTGPALFDLTSEEVEAILADEDQWGVVLGVYDPAQPIAFLADGFELPRADELTLGVRGGLPRNSGSYTLIYIDRDYANLVEDFVGDFGYRTLADPITGDPLLDGETGEPARFDIGMVDNASTAERQYRALAATWDYRPGVRWNVGGNWTYSETTGNYQGYSPDGLEAGGPIGNYVRSRPEEAAVPDGFLIEDVRNRFQIWGNYRWDLRRIGSMVLGAVGRYESGANWSRTALLPLAEDPEYNNETGQSYSHYFDGRGENRFDDWWTLDLSARWQFTIYKRLDTWLKASAINVFNNDALIAYDTTGTASSDASGNLIWEPAGNCAPGDTPSVDCTGFGRIRSQRDYQTPRSYLFTLGLSF